VLAAAGLAVVGLVVGGAFWWFAAGSHHKTDATSAGLVSTAAQPASATTQPVKTPVSAATSPAASQATSPVADAAASVAAAASAKAVQKAAVPFPGAPALGSRTPSVNHLNPQHKYVAITLDDGYNYQPAMLELFKQYDVHCTTFLIGSWAATHKNDLKDMKAAGFEIANHSWSHPFLTKLSSAQISSELKKTQKVISSVTGDQAPYLRPPFGATNSSVKATAASLGYRIVMWDRTFGDSGRGATPKKLYSNVMYSGGGVKPGDIILCHWGSKPSYEALKKVLPDLKAQGYEFVTVSELIADSKGN
jgi:peptidoglycan/xylan/chitin deacetylase (PgdA/CDA1 family)